MNCRHCSAPLRQTFVDLGVAPPSNAYLSMADLTRPERTYPLKVMVCEHCWLVQTVDYAAADEFFSADYAYFSSTSATWLAHAERYGEAMIQRLSLTRDSFVIEVACNDGYLLRNFVAAGIPCLGIEPTASTAAAAEVLGIAVLREFFGEALGKRLAAEGRQADLIAGNNVYAHVPDINDFTRGLKAALKPGGTITLEFPHLMRLIEQAQFDTIYHEHFSYLSLHTAQRIFAAAGLRVFDVEELPTHGGSLRLYGCHVDDARATAPAVGDVLREEERRSLRTLEPYRAFQPRADRIRDELLRFLNEQKAAGKRVAAYGAAAKQGKFMPGSHIPILPPEVLAQRRPDFLLILPWNIADEIIAKQAPLAAQGTKFVTAVPRLVIA